MHIPGTHVFNARIPLWGTVLALLAVFGLLFGAAFLPHHHRGSDRGACIMNQRNTQQAVRAYASFHALKVGDAIGWSKIIGFGQFIEKVPECPVHGINAYTYSQTIPAPGVPVAPCKDPAHKPPTTENW